MLKSLMFISLILGSSFFAKATIVCSTNSYSNEINDGILIIEPADPNEYLNGKITFSGDKLTKHFLQELTSLGAQCYQASGPSRTECSFYARTYFDSKKFFNGGRFELGFLGQAEGEGLKLFSTFDGTPNGKDWYFNYCENR
jgi:hypothetical protein